MRQSARLQLLICLMVYASSAQAIMVKFGTKGGPIEPPVPVPSVPPPKPYRNPAPVWEERANDVPDPNAQWRPELFVPQPRYTQVVFNPLPPQNLNKAQQFVNAYLPRNPQPIQGQPIREYFTPSQVVSQLSSQSLPGIGIRYFVPLYVNNLHNIKNEHRRQEDAKVNEIETNEVNAIDENVNDLQWKQEKEAALRTVRTAAEATPTPYVYQFPAYVRHQ